MSLFLHLRLKMQDWGCYICHEALPFSSRLMHNDASTLIAYITDIHYHNKEGDR